MTAESGSRPAHVVECVCGLWAQQGCIEASGVYWESMLNLDTHAEVEVCTKEEEHKGHIGMRKENKYVEFFIEKACTCQGLATESVCHYEI